MNQELKTERSLKRTLGLFASTMMVVGLIIGSGVFKKIIPMAQTGLGETAILMAWILAGVISLFGAFTISGLASLTEESGGLYEYFRISLGNFIAFLSGWADFLIIGPAAIAALGFLFGDIVNTVSPLPNPLDAWKDISVANVVFPFANSGVKLVGISAIVVLTGINLLGSRESGVFNSVITTAKIVGIVLLIVVGITYAKPEIVSNHEIINTVAEPEGMLFYSAFLAAMLGAFWAYNGWDIATNISGEIVNPKRNLPIALTLGVLLVIVLYALVNYSYLQVLSLERLRAVTDNEIGAFVVSDTLFGSYGKTLLVILFVICVFGALNSNVVTVPRKYFRMAQEGYLFKHIQHVHPRFRTPDVALGYTMVLSCVLLVSGSFDMLTDMVIFTSFLFYGLLAIAVIKLKRNGTIKAKVVGYPFVPMVLLVFSIALTINTIWVHPKQSLVGLFLIMSGVPLYYYFQKRNGQAIN